MSLGTRTENWQMQQFIFRILDWNLFTKYAWNEGCTAAAIGWRLSFIEPVVPVYLADTPSYINTIGTRGYFLVYTEYREYGPTKMLPAIAETTS